MYLCISCRKQRYQRWRLQLRKLQTQLLMVGITLISNWHLNLYLHCLEAWLLKLCFFYLLFVLTVVGRHSTRGSHSHFHDFTLSLVHVADVAGENLVHLVDEHEHVAVLFYNSLDKSTKKVRVVIQNSWTYLSSDMKKEMTLLARMLRALALAPF